MKKQIFSVRGWFYLLTALFLLAGTGLSSYAQQGQQQGNNQQGGQQGGNSNYTGGQGQQGGGSSSGGGSNNNTGGQQGGQQGGGSSSGSGGSSNNNTSNNNQGGGTSNSSVDDGDDDPPTPGLTVGLLVSQQTIESCAAIDSAIPGVKIVGDRVIYNSPQGGNFCGILNGVNVSWTSAATNRWLCNSHSDCDWQTNVLYVCQFTEMNYNPYSNDQPNYPANGACGPRRGKDRECDLRQENVCLPGYSCQPFIYGTLNYSVFGSMANYGECQSTTAGYSCENGVLESTARDIPANMDCSCGANFITAKSGSIKYIVEGLQSNYTVKGSGSNRKCYQAAGVPTPQ